MPSSLSSGPVRCQQISGKGSKGCSAVSKSFFLDGCLDREVV